LFNIINVLVVEHVWLHVRTMQDIPIPMVMLISALFVFTG
jgi:hypothetical protein